MYETIFSLANRPFLAAPRNDRYFPAAPIETARQTLVRGIERAEGPGLLIGPAGSGKTLICQLLAEQFSDQYNVVLLSSTRLCTPRALLQNILFELELPYRELEEGELRLNLIDFLQRSEKCPNGMLLVVDEANTLPLRLLEEIRMITNVVRDGVPRVRLVLVGGPQLEERFASPRLESLNQRIAARCYLQSMTREETAHYVLHQIAQAGGDGESLFTEDALRAVYHATDGIPRLVNQVCDHALMLAASEGHQRLSSNSIEAAWADLQQLPAPSLTVDQFSNSDASGDVSEMIEFGQLDDELDAVLDHPIEFESEEELISLADASSQEDAHEASEIDNGDECQMDELPVHECDLDESVETELPATSVEDSDLVQSADPFGHEFEEEEVVLDRYASLDSFPCEAVHASSHEELPSQTNEDESVAQRQAADDPSTELEPDADDLTEEVASSDAAAEMESAILWQPTIADPTTNDLPQHGVDDYDEAPCSMDDPSGDAVEHEDAQPTIHCIDDANEVEPEVADDDRDMIIIEEDVVHSSSVSEPVGPRVRRREYRHLFAKLRQS
jgi:type II secretory pathway predicted ATPase ExeA